MSYEVSVPEGCEYVLVKWSGTAPVEETQRAGIDAINRVNAEGFSRILVDVTDVTQKRSVLDQYTATDKNSKLSSPRPRCALLGRPDQESELGFVETVGRNRGMVLRAFTDRTEALAWLME